MGCDVVSPTTFPGIPGSLATLVRAPFVARKGQGYLADSITNHRLP